MMQTAPVAQANAWIQRASFGDTLAVIADVVAPTLAKGVIIRRPQVLSLAERLNVDRRAVRRMQRLRARYGTGPLLLRIPARRYAVILDPEHVHRVLDGSPEPFAADTIEKHAALAHFEPAGVLISRGADRADRRRFNEAVLDSDRLMHRLSERFSRVVDEEMSLLIQGARYRATLTWDDFVNAWFRMIRRVVLGDDARDDYILTSLLSRLRGDANWAFLRPRRTNLRRRFLDRLGAHLARAESGSLAGIMPQIPTTDRTCPEQQVPQWLFASAAAAIATFRALAVLATHDEHAAQARDEASTYRDGSGGDYLPFLRSCILESLRLWPTTPLVLRETTQETTWGAGTLPAGTGVLIFAPFFHRDDQRLGCANQFTPSLWHDDAPTTDWPFIPFSSGPAGCPGQHLVLLVASVALARLLSVDRLRLEQAAKLNARNPLPGTLNHFALRFTLA